MFLCLNWRRHNNVYPSIHPLTKVNISTEKRTFTLLKAAKNEDEIIYVYVFFGNFNDEKKYT